MAETSNEQTAGREGLIGEEGTLSCRFGRQQWTFGTSVGMSVVIHLGMALIFAFCATQTVSKSREKEIVFVELSQSLAMPVVKPAAKSTAERSVLPKPRQQVTFSPPQLVERLVPAQVAPSPHVAVPQQVIPVISPKSVIAQPQVESPAVGGSVLPGKAPSPAVTASVVAGVGKSTLVTTVAGDSKASIATDHGGDMTFGAASAPSFQLRTIPAYPSTARRFGKEGTVILRLSIDEFGNLSGTEVVQDPGYGFATAAVEAVKKSRFNPAHSKGRPVAAKAILPIRFALQGAN